ncbi:MAG: DNA cytosine methyltransferase [Smithella sp.]|jgi:DNA (cytosine-5)-methyltransferase 1
MQSNYKSIDVFSGLGGLSEGMRQAGFEVKAAIEIDTDAVAAYKMNHSSAVVFNQDIRDVKGHDMKKYLGDKKLHLLAGCPPCQGFSSVRKLNKKRSVRDDRNKLILEYLRFVKELLPLTVMMENVPGLMDYYLFKILMDELGSLGYNPKVEIVKIQDYGVPQRRKRLVLVGSLLGDLNVAPGNEQKTTVKDAIGHLDHIDCTADPLHKITAHHSERIRNLIALIPKNGGSRNDLPEDYILACHRKNGVGFKDIYGRLRWNDVANTITGGCLNPSKGRFLHPEENRVITAREAALLQSFPQTYQFPDNVTKASLASLIGNALPPKFSFIQCKNIKDHLDKYLG